jgi:hypothetical protein
VREHGLKIIVKAQDDAEAKKDAPAPEAAPQDEYNRLLVDKIYAEVKFESLLEKRKAEKDTAADAEKAEEDKRLEASRAFAQAHHAWLTAKAGIEDPAVEEDEQAGRFRAESDAERRLFTTLPRPQPIRINSGRSSRRLRLSSAMN